ncbi:MAG: hypothetical protein V8S30_00145 [Merdibacter sp.]
MKGFDGKKISRILRGLEAVPEDNGLLCKMIIDDCNGLSLHKVQKIKPIFAEVEMILKRFDVEKKT